MRLGLVLLLCALGLAARADTVLILGDSISAAYGIDKATGWVSLLEQKLSSQCPSVTVKNASVSGETTAGGLARLSALLEQAAPELVVLELGGNDGLRGLSTKAMQGNLEQMTLLARQAGADVVILGIHMPGNFGKAFRTRFDQAFKDAAANQNVPLLPFFLDQVFDRPELMQQDGIHPTAEAQPQLLQNALTVILPALSEQCPQLADKN